MQSLDLPINFIETTLQKHPVMHATDASVDLNFRFQHVHKCHEVYGQ